MTRSAPVEVLRHPVMTPVPLAGTAAYAADPTPTSTVAAATEMAANLCFFDWNTEVSCFGPGTKEWARVPATWMRRRLSPAAWLAADAAVPESGPVRARNGRHDRCAWAVRLLRGFPLRSPRRP